MVYIHIYIYIVPFCSHLNTTFHQHKQASPGETPGLWQLGDASSWRTPDGLGTVRSGHAVVGSLKAFRCHGIYRGLGGWGGWETLMWGNRTENEGSWQMSVSQTKKRWRGWGEDFFWLKGQWYGTVSVVFKMFWNGLHDHAYLFR